MNRELMLQKRIRFLTTTLILGLVISGATAIPLESEVKLLAGLTGASAEVAGRSGSPLTDWVARVREGLHETNARFPFMAYGTDWLAFAHFVIAIAFIGAWRDPVRNLWLFDFGLIACVLVIPHALLFGWVRGIPAGWRLIDCSFGVLGAIPLWFCRRYAREMSMNGDAPRARPGGDR